MQDHQHSICAHVTLEKYIRETERLYFGRRITALKFAAAAQKFVILGNENRENRVRRINYLRSAE